MRLKYDYLFLPDLHIPAIDWKAVEWAARKRDQFKIDKVVQLGDLTDQRIWSRFSHDPDFDNPDREWDMVERDMRRLHKLFPEMTIILGNHDSRIIKKAVEAGLPSQLMRTLSDIFPFKGWEWHTKPEPLVLEQQIAVVHGDELTGAVAHKAQAMGMCLVQGHTHQARLEYVTMFNKTIWGAEAGCLVDVDSSAFRYAQKNPRRQTKSILLTLDSVPLIMPYQS